MISLKQLPEEVYIYKADSGMFEPIHEDAYIERACCSPYQRGESGYVECGCHGMDSIICPAWDCPGIREWEIEVLFERLENA